MEVKDANYIIDNVEDLSAEKERLVQAAQDEVDLLLAKFDTPITRPQWAAWLEANFDEFSEAMKTATQRRRLLNTRVRARPNLPQRPQRIQAKKEPTQSFKSVWAVNLARRTGWHGIHTATTKMMFFLAWNNGETFFIDMEPYRVGVPDELSYELNQHFDLVAQLKPLSLLDADLTGETVLGAFRFVVGSTPTTGGIRIRPLQGCRIQFPVPKPPRKTMANEEEDEDIVEDLGTDDSCSSGAVVDTDVESAIESSGSSTETVIEDSDHDADSDAAPGAAHMKPARSGEDAKDLKEPTTRCRAKENKPRQPSVWHNQYFTMSDPASTRDRRVIMTIKKNYQGKDGMGTTQLSKTLTPSHYGESNEYPIRSMMLLRAWSLWRGNANGWSSQNVGRARYLEDEKTKLAHEIKKLGGQGDSLLGNAAADKLLKEWMPDLVPT